MSTKSKNPWDDVPMQSEHSEPLSLPFIQWANGKPGLKQVHPILASGGFEMPLNQFKAATVDGVVPDFFKPCDVPHSGEVEAAYLAQSLHLAILAHRFSWTLKGKRIPQHVEGARGKLQVAALVRDFDTQGLIMLTLRGKSSQFFFAAMRTFEDKIRIPAAALATTKFPIYAFWLPIKAGKSRKASEAQPTKITPPVPAWIDKEIDDDFLRSLFVGKEVIARAEALWAEAQDWRMDWNMPSRGSNGDANGDEIPA